MKKIKILAIAPFEDMKMQIESVAKNYSNISLTVYIGNLEEGVSIAKSELGEMYDIIISRGGTASLIEKFSPIPVVEIETSIYDILCSLKLSQVLVESDSTKKTAIIGYKNIIVNAHLLCEVLNYTLDVYTIEDTYMVEPILQNIKQKGYDLIICDMVTNIVAKDYNINTILINSGKDSIKKAFDDALKIAKSYVQLSEENYILRKIIEKDKDYTVVFDKNETIYYSSLDSNVDNDFVLTLLRYELKNVFDDTRKIVKFKNQLIYSIIATRIKTDISSYYIFNLYIKKANSSLIKNKIIFQSYEDIYKTISDSLLISSNSNILEPYISTIKKVNSPVMIIGENGTGKIQTANYLYLKSSKKNFPLITINCQILNEKSLTFLLESQHSPLFDVDNTLLFNNIDLLDEYIADELIENLLLYNVTSKNQLFFCNNVNKNTNLSITSQKIIDKLNCLTIKLLPLREQPNNIPPLISRYYNKLNTTLDHQIAGVSPEGVRLLQKFDWPHNFTQFKRLLNNMAISSKSPIISTDTVLETINNETNTLTIDSENELINEPINLSKTLSEIQIDIVKKVLKDVDNNQTKAAERLGISRATLWRMLK